ncbi:MAG: cytochrome d ubiquinol oxidase subunit II [Myxococcota bacterium]|nr:cytochrome d ubiquinol oxidase subunit II [Myxococcota bacterium]
MPGADDVLAVSLLVAAVLYAVTGGADYGAGLWDLLASGPRAAAQRALIERSIAPIWEANHVWLIFIVTVLFAAFPPAYAAISIALHVPMTILLLGIVARGAAFVFRAYDTRGDRVQRRWGLVFSIASIVSPVFLGVLVGSIASGEIHFEGDVLASGFAHPWSTTAFPWAVGALALVLFAYLAAIYLAYAAEERALADDFRARALATAMIAALLAVATLALARSEAPAIYADLLHAPFAMALFGGTAAAALVTVVALLRRRYGIARVAAAVQVALVVLGWGAAQAPYLLTGELTYREASSPPEVQRAILGVVALGAPLLGGALVYMFRVFHRTAPRATDREE